MKNFIVVILCVIFAVVVWARPEEEKYSSDNDNFDVGQLLPNDRARRGYINCLKTGQKCTPEGQELRGILPEAIENGCKKCTERQKEQAKKVLDYTLKNHPDEYKELADVFDPNGTYRKKHEEGLKKEGVVLPD